ncbi:hypothetical protein DY000_02037458 [Brassica cretica]|nr:hypothetical protein DY000_02037458 [Brassica cretica]
MNKKFRDLFCKIEEATIGEDRELSDDVAHRSSQRGDEHGNGGDDLDQRFRSVELQRGLELVRLWATVESFDGRSATAAR